MRGVHADVPLMVAVGPAAQIVASLSVATSLLSGENMGRRLSSDGLVPREIDDQRLGCWARCHRLFQGFTEVP